MADSRDKGMRAEYAVRDLLRKFTGLQWERVPGSGGFGKSHGLKGDVYLPPNTGTLSKFCIEVKHYADDVIASKLLNPTVSQLEKFWEQTVRESGEMSAKPMLIFKKDRGKWICAMETHETELQPVMVIFKEKMDGIGLYLFDDVVKLGKEFFVKC
jgi:hypothetical protein